RDRSRPAALGLNGKRDVFGHRKIADDAIGLALFRAEGEALGNRRNRRGQPDFLSVNGKGSAVGLIDAEHQERGFRAARTEKTRNADGFSGLDREVEGRNAALLAEARKTDRRNRLVADFFSQLAAYGFLQLMAKHHGNQVGSRQLGKVAAADQPSVAQHGGAISNGIDLIEKMGDDDNAKAVSLQLPQHA